MKPVNCCLAMLGLATGLVMPQAAGENASRARLAEEKPFDSGSVNDTFWRPVDRGALIRAQILLDRANFSPGEIDGREGRNLRRAVRAFQKHRNLHSSGELDEPTWTELNSDTRPVLATYTLGTQEAAGPFAAIPADMMAKAKLKALSWASPEEAVGEQFHISPKLLKLMNPGSKFAAGEQIVVPDIGLPAQGRAARIIITTAGNLTALDEAGNVIAHFPCSSGSEHDPLPIGEWKVTKVYPNPEFHYNPELFWDADPSHSKAKIAPGPNNPVGVVWIDITKEHYGIHGTPAPETVGHAQSHGCIRLTNWDARELADMTEPGTIVSCEKEP